MKKNKTVRFLLLLFAFFNIAWGMSGCSDSSLTERGVIRKVEELAIHDSDMLGWDVKVRSVEDHSGKLLCWIGRIHPKFPQCDEIWKVRINSDRWVRKQILLCRRGGYYFLMVR